MSQQAPQWQWDSSSRRWYVYDRKSSHRIYEDGERRLATSETRADSLSSRSRTIPDLSAPADRRTTYGRSNASRPSASRREDSINASQARQHGTATSRPDPTTLADRVAREFASVTLRNDSMLPPSNKERDSRTSQSQQPADAPQPLRSQRATGTVSTSSRADSATALQSRNHLATTENQPTSGSTSHDREARIQAAIARLMARDYSASQAQEAVRIQLNAIASRDLDSSDTDGEDSSSDGSEDSRTPQAAQRSGPGTTRTDSRVTRARRQAYPPRSDSRPHTARSSTTNATSALEVPNASSKSGSATDQIRSQTRTTLQSPSTLQSDPRQVPPESWTEAAVRAVMQQGYTREQAVQYLTTSAARARSGQQQSVIRTSPLAEGSKSQDVLGAPAGGRAIEPPPQTQRTPGVEQNEQSEVKLQAVPFPPGQVTDRDTKIYTTVDPSSGYRCSIEIGKAKAITSRSLQEQRVMVRQVILYSAVDRQSSGPSASSGMQGTASGTANNGNASTSPNTSPPIGAAPESLSTKISSIQGRLQVADEAKALLTMRPASTSARTQRSSRDWKKGKVCIHTIIFSADTISYK